MHSFVYLKRSIVLSGKILPKTSTNRIVVGVGSCLIVVLSS